MFHDPIPSKPEQLKNLQERFQSLDIFPAEMIEGFSGIEVVATGAKKQLPIEPPLTRDEESGVIDPADERSLAAPNIIHNADCILADAETGLLGVFDGLGSTSNSSRASRLAAETIVSIYGKFIQWTNRMDRATAISNAVEKVLTHQIQRIMKVTKEIACPYQKEDIQKKSAREMITFHEQRDPDILLKAAALIHALSEVHLTVQKLKPPTSTTACVGFVHTSPDKSRWAVVTNLGDSGAMIRRADGTVESMTETDALLSRCLQTEIPNETPEERIQFFQSLVAEPNQTWELTNIPGEYSYKKLLASMMSAVGNKDREVIYPPSLNIVQLFEGDELILCTDGILDKFQKHEYTADTQEELFNTQAFGEALGSNNAPLVDTANALRQESTSRTTPFKISDDIALVIARMMA